MREMQFGRFEVPEEEFESLYENRGFLKNERNDVEYCGWVGVLDSRVE
jgi:hypothetical protein